MRPEHHRIVTTAQAVGNSCHQPLCSLIGPSDPRTMVRVRVAGLSGLPATVDMQPYAHSRLMGPRGGGLHVSHNTTNARTPLAVIGQIPHDINSRLNIRVSAQAIRSGCTIWPPRVGLLVSGYDRLPPVAHI
jgi:hypothetical protein